MFSEEGFLEAYVEGNYDYNQFKTLFLERIQEIFSLFGKVDRILEIVIERGKNKFYILSAFMDYMDFKIGSEVFGKEENFTKEEVRILDRMVYKMMREKTQRVGEIKFMFFSSEVKTKRGSIPKRSGKIEWEEDENVLILGFDGPKLQDVIMYEMDRRKRKLKEMDFKVDEGKMEGYIIESIIESFFTIH